MNIALIGYGKMGKAIEEIAIERGHNITLRISTANKHEMTPDNLRMADVAIEFTNPEVAKDNVVACLDAGVSVVCGSTGWNEQVHVAKMKAAEMGKAFLQASNFSIGVNIFFEVNKMLASLMDDQPSYNITVEETHHTQKKDAPSGTAITIAEQILENMSRKKHWAKESTDNPEAFPIIAHRTENVPGTHNVKYSSEIDDIEIIHTAHNRKGFALGAVLAAEYINGKEGIFEMRDVLGIKKVEL
ncbi:MAG: 4-hydroxy-tetrahydrodipicolinate reductase [Bacteroidetes bacterium]|nr:4-hydroxy-tetrahydrodipicolinate reductase [Bacteroidota bacterium]